MGGGSHGGLLVLIPVIALVVAIGAVLLMWQPVSNVSSSSESPSLSSSPVSTVGSNTAGKNETTPLSSTPVSTISSNIISENETMYINNTLVSGLRVLVYLGTSKLTVINITETEWSRIYSDISSIARINDSIRIIFFGSITCPHCHAQSGFFNTTMSSRVVYLWIENNTVASVFFELYNLEVSKGLSPNYAGGVPHMLVIDENKKLKAIVIGEAEDTAFWNTLLS